MKTDAQLRKDVIEQLRLDPQVLADDIIVTAHHGVVTLSGTVPHFADKCAAERATQRVEGVKAIAEEMEVHLTGEHDRKDADVAAAAVSALSWNVRVPKHIVATINNGWLTLTGTASWGFQREAAADAVRYLSGVKGVSNGIILKPTAAPTAVKDAVEKALKRDAEVKAEQIIVSVDGGKVILAGTVGTWDEREEALVTAWNTPGVTQVDNHLAVSY